MPHICMNHIYFFGSVSSVRWPWFGRTTEPRKMAEIRPNRTEPNSSVVHQYLANFGLFSIKDKTWFTTKHSNVIPSNCLLVWLHSCIIGLYLSFQSGLAVTPHMHCNATSVNTFQYKCIYVSLKSSSICSPKNKSAK